MGHYDDSYEADRKQYEEQPEIIARRKREKEIRAKLMIVLDLRTNKDIEILKKIINNEM